MKLIRLVKIQTGRLFIHSKDHIYKFIPFICVTVAIIAIVSLCILLHWQSSPEIIRQEHTVPNVVYALGRIEGLSDEIHLRTEILGTIERIYVEEGQWVEFGDVLLQLDSILHEGELAIAEAQLEHARAELIRLQNGAHPEEIDELESLVNAKESEYEQARSNWERLKKLSETPSVVTQQQLDESVALARVAYYELISLRSRLNYLKSLPRPDDIKIAESQLEIARANVELVRNNLEKTRLKAPIAGQILHIEVEEGEISNGAIIISDTRRFRVRAFVEELDAARIQAGMPVEIISDSFEERFKGKIIHISPRMGPKRLWSDRPDERFDTKTREVWVEFDEHFDNLIVGLRVDIVISLEP